MHRIWMWGPYVYMCVFGCSQLSFVVCFVLVSADYESLYCPINIMYAETIVMTSIRACPRWGRSRNEGGGVATHSATTEHIGVRSGHVCCKMYKL